MKKYILLFTILFIANLLAAQITVTSATFPATGDTLKMASDLTPGGIEITVPGGDQNWDYTSLAATVTSETVFQDASAGTVAAEVPSATHVTIDPNTGAESYFEVSTDAVRFIAANGEDPVGAGIQALFRFQPPIVERRAPMTFPANNDSESNLNITFPWDILPPIVTDSLTLPITPDSIRIRVVQSRNDFVDAWGTLDIPGGSYEVLREKRTLYRDTRIDAYIVLPIIGGSWQDVTDLLPSAPGGMFEGIGQDTIISYNFFSDTEKEIIAEVTMNNDETAVQRVNYKDNDFVSSIEEAKLLSIGLSPNPASEVVRLTLGDFPPGEYQLKVISLSGNIVLGKTVFVSNGQVEALDVSHLSASTYFLQITDKKGEIKAVEKLVKK